MPVPVPENVLQQLMETLQALGTQRRRPDKKERSPIFNNLPDEKPYPHLLKVNDWFDNNRTPDMRSPTISNTLFMI